MADYADRAAETVERYRNEETWFTSGSFRPSVGEAVDRLTILALKVLYARDPARFLAEQYAVREWLREQCCLHALTCPASQDLAAINAAIWHLTGDVRLRLKNGAERADGIGDQYFQAYLWNEQRATLIRIINEAMEQPASEEKV